MKRKTAIFSIAALGAGVAATFSGYKWYAVHKTPDINYLDAHQQLIDHLTEIIIPATNTPGARSALAYETVIRLIKNAGRVTQNNFIDGLKSLQSYSINEFDKTFIEISKEQQIKIVTHFQQEGRNYTGKLGKIKNKLLGKSFFHILKEYTTIAYCTSQPGATQALAYDYIPGKYEACISLQSGQKSWATK